MKVIPFFPQERPESCVPACLRMVLAYHGKVLSEIDLYNCCETDVDGTFPSAAARCAQSLGFIASASRLDGISALQGLMNNSFDPVIVFVNLSPLLGINVIHAVIVERIEEFTVVIFDPACPPHGRRRWNLPLFEVGWTLARCQIIQIAAP